jgi:hypothetical protein
MSFDYELSPRELARMELLVEKLTADARAVGLTLDRDSILTLPSVRLAIISPEAGLPSNYMDEVCRLPAVAGQLRKQELAQQLDEPESPLHQDLSRMNPAQRMNFGRELEAAKRAQEAAARAARPGMTAEEEADAIRMVMRMPTPAGRMDAARAAGLL